MHDARTIEENLIAAGRRCGLVWCVSVCVENIPWIPKFMTQGNVS
jgi:hypothetical protein